MLIAGVILLCRLADSNDLLSLFLYLTHFVSGFVLVSLYFVIVDRSTVVFEPLEKVASEKEEEKLS